MQQPRIWLVEDEQSIVDTLVYMLQQEGFQVTVFGRGLPALEAAAHQAPDVAILDVGLPDIGGFELCRRLLTRYPALPVLFLTARSDEVDKLLGLEIGADDYIAKPFSQRLLIARIRAVLRRAENRRQTGLDDAEGEGSAIIRGRLEMNPARHRVRWDGKDVSLTVTEFMILEALAHRPDVVKSRNQLMDAAYQDDVYVDDRTIDSHIKRLRRKFRQVDPDFDAIDTLYGAGYRFSAG